MLARPSRLTSDKDYSLVYRRGRRFRAHGFAGIVLATPSPTRIGIVVSKKVSLKATVRNRYKRWFSAALRELKALIPAQGYHIVLAANPTISSQTFQSLRAELKPILASLPHHGTK